MTQLSHSISLSDVFVRSATLDDVTRLIEIENSAFSGDRLSRRSFRHAIKSQGAALLVAVADGVLGYALLHLRQGTRLARLYSLAVSPEARGLGVAKTLLLAIEKQAMKQGKSLLRLEVSEKNSQAIQLYSKLGYREFGHYQAYYEDATDALRMQKVLRPGQEVPSSRRVPWLAQGTPFTCGPASLQMVLSTLDDGYQATPDKELDIWREATTIFMTSGHGGCHPMGLALAAKKRGLKAEVCLSQTEPLFVDGVRDELKKDVIIRVHVSFTRQCEQQSVPVQYEALAMQALTTAFDQGKLAIILISTYRMDGKKAPHWVVMSGYDEHNIYVHDPDYEADDHLQNEMDCQYVPIARKEFEKMSRFGQKRLQAIVLLWV